LIDYLHAVQAIFASYGFNITIIAGSANPVIKAEHGAP
jgi:hypothetical protein